MTDNEIKKALDILDRFDLFGGQRAGRELWNEKPVDVQNEDIENFVKDVVFLKDLINRLQEENERLNTHLDVLGCSTDKIKAEAYKEFAELCKKEVPPYSRAIIDILLKEMVGEDNA